MGCRKLRHEICRSKSPAVAWSIGRSSEGARATVVMLQFMHVAVVGAGGADLRATLGFAEARGALAEALN